MELALPIANKIDLLHFSQRATAEKTQHFFITLFHNYIKESHLVFQVTELSSHWVQMATASDSVLH